MTLAASSVTGMASSTSGTRTVAWLATPAPSANSAQAHRPAITPSGIPMSSAAAASVVASHATTP